MDASYRLVLVSGTRPNVIKVAALVRAFSIRLSPFTIDVLQTGQHRDAAMSKGLLEELGLGRPGVLSGGDGSSGDGQTARILERFERWLRTRARRPRGIIVVGDVDSTAACALAAFRVGIPVAHVEAGLRSFDHGMPEEINRVVTDAVAEVLLVSEPSGEANLRREGFAPERIRFVGNVMIDTLVQELPAARARAVPATLDLPPGRYALVTLHRPSNVDEPERLERLVNLLERLARRLPLVFAVHPRTRDRLARFGQLARLRDTARVRLTDPLAYREHLGLMAEAGVVVTDSGGVQEETSYLGVPCLTLRTSTERPITITEGTNTLVGDRLEQVDELVEEALAGGHKKGCAIRGWDGHAAERVVDTLVERWGR